MSESIYTMRARSAAEVVSAMRLGWNLGNTLDSLTSTPAGLSAETAWGNPRVTKELFSAVAAAGFGAVRIPVTWAGHFQDEKACTVEPEWMNRVEEIARYAMECGLFVILNLHHDGADFAERGAWLLPDYKNYDQVLPRFASLWTQIAQHFAAYGDLLLFEGMNEPHCDDDWVGSMEHYIIINRLNEIFVETVRSTGSNNSKRKLLIPTYAASPKQGPVGAMVYPQDDNLILSVHAYIPTAFCFPSYDVHWAEPMDSWGTDADKEKIVTAFDLLAKQKLPVIIGEMGAVQKRNPEERRRWARFFLSEAKKRGIVCFWWDAFTQGESMGLLDRTTLQWTDPDLLGDMLAAIQ